MSAIGQSGNAASARKKSHPTRERLVATTLALLQDLPPEQISAEMILQTSGVSKGSLYHHFEDLSDLIETALMRTFTETVDQNIAFMGGLLDAAHTPEQFFLAVQRFNDLTQSPDRRAVRFERIRLIGNVANNPRLAARMAEQQTRLTEGYTELFRLAQTRGLMDNDFDPRAAAVLIQAYTLGRIVDDIVADQVDPTEWNALVMKVVLRVFGVAAN